MKFTEQDSQYAYISIQGNMHQLVALSHILISKAKHATAGLNIIIGLLALMNLILIWKL